MVPRWHWWTLLLEIALRIVPGISALSPAPGTMSGMSVPWLNVPLPDQSAYVWSLTRPASDQDAWAAVREVREAEAVCRYRAWCIARLGREPAFDARSPARGRISRWMLRDLPVRAGRRDHEAAFQLSVAYLLRSVAVAHLFWDDDTRWAVAAGLLGAGWAGSDRELHESVLASTTGPESVTKP